MELLKVKVRPCGCGHGEAAHNVLVYGPLETPTYDYSCNKCHCQEYDPWPEFDEDCEDHDAPHRW